MAVCILTRVDRHAERGRDSAPLACPPRRNERGGPTQVTEPAGHSAKIRLVSTPSASKIKARSPNAGSWQLWAGQTDALPRTSAHPMSGR